VQDLLGHAQLETTKAVYLAPVADLQLRSLLADFVPAGGPVSEQELTALEAP
jgi:site-specific recombinase XerD